LPNPLTMTEVSHVSAHEALSQRTSRPWWSGVVAALRATRADAAAGRTRRIVLALAFIWIVTIFDLLFTILAHRIGNFQELNPIARGLLDVTEALIVYKLALVGVASIIFYVFRRHRLTELACWACCVVFTGLVFLWMAYYTAAA